MVPQRHLGRVFLVVEGDSVDSHIADCFGYRFVNTPDYLNAICQVRVLEGIIGKPAAKNSRVARIGSLFKDFEIALGLLDHNVISILTS